MSLAVASFPTAVEIAVSLLVTSVPIAAEIADVTSLIAGTLSDAEAVLEILELTMLIFPCKAVSLAANAELTAPLVIKLSLEAVTVVSTVPSVALIFPSVSLIALIYLFVPPASATSNA